MIELRNGYWAVEVPEGAAGFDVNQYVSGSELNYWLIEKDEQTLIVKDLPPGTWEIVCMSKEVSETIAGQIVEKDGDVFYKCYAGKRSHISPLRSLFCLMDENGCDLEQNIFNT